MVSSFNFQELPQQRLGLLTEGDEEARYVICFHRNNRHPLHCRCVLQAFLDHLAAFTVVFCIMEITESHLESLESKPKSKVS